MGVGAIFASGSVAFAIGFRPADARRSSAGGAGNLVAEEAGGASTSPKVITPHRIRASPRPLHVTEYDRRPGQSASLIVVVRHRPAHHASAGRPVQAGNTWGWCPSLGRSGRTLQNQMELHCVTIRVGEVPWDRGTPHKMDGLSRDTDRCRRSCRHRLLCHWFSPPDREEGQRLSAPHHQCSPSDAPPLRDWRTRAAAVAPGFLICVIEFKTSIRTHTHLVTRPL